MISAVVVAWGQAPFLERCVTQLLASQGPDVEVIVVDNGVTDGSVAALRPDDGLRRVQAPGNLGFGGGCNLGAGLATGDVIAFVNPDALVEPGALAALAGALHDPTVGIATAQIRLLQEPELVNSAGGAIHFLGLGWAVGFRQPAGRFNTARDVAAASGAAMAVRGETFATLGGFTEELFLYHEDADLSWRCWMAGWRVVYVPAAVVLHDYQFDRHPDKLHYLERNRLALVLTCYETRTLCLLAPALLAFETGMLALAAAQGWIPAKVSGWTWLFRHRHWLRQQRGRCQAQRRRGDAALAGLLHSRFDATHFTPSFPVRAADRVLAAYWVALLRLTLRPPPPRGAELGGAQPKPGDEHLTILRPVTPDTPIEPEPASYKKLSVIVPVYDERNTVAEIIRRAKTVELPLDREIVVVDDGSTDGTREVLSHLVDSTVHVILHPENRGKGAAIRTGLAQATGDLVIIQDADLEYDPDDWIRLLAPVLKGKARVVYGSRFTGERRNMLFLHWIGNRFLTLVTNALYNTTLSDMETCYKLFDRRVLDGITLTSDRFGFEPEVTAKVLRSGERIYEVPISYAGREFNEGKKITWRDGFSALGILVRHRVGPRDRH